MGFILCFFFIICLAIEIFLQFSVFHFPLFIFCIFAQAKITQLDMTLIINEYVIRFQIPVDIVQHMHLFDCKNLGILKLYTLSEIEPSLLFGKDVLFHEQRHEVSASQILHHQVQVLVVLKRTFQVYDPFVVCFC